MLPLSQANLPDGEPTMKLPPRKRFCLQERVSLPKAAPPPSKEAATTKPSRIANERKVNILSLPDEALSLIFHHLQATETSGTFQGPRQAFALARTNTRPFRIFFSLLTRIVPEILNDCPPTLSCWHFSFVLQRTPYLRELHLPRTSCRLLRELPVFCPRLEKLVFVDDHYQSSAVFVKLMALRIQALSIYKPSQAVLRALIPPPENLSLFEVDAQQIEDIEPILRQPPKRLDLHTEYERFESSELMRCLREACPKMEEVTVRAVVTGPIPRNDFYGYVKSLLERPQNRASKCLKMALSGNVMDLIEHAHPAAVIEISRFKDTFVKDATGIYAKRLSMSCRYLTHNLSKLEVFCIDGNDFSTPWQNLISGMWFPHLRVLNTSLAEHLQVHADVVEIPFLRFRGSGWTWLSDAKEVRILYSKSPERFFDEISTEKEFLRSLAQLLHRFHGRLLWMDDCPTVSRWKDIEFRALIRAVSHGVVGFECRGGDAGTIKDMVNRFQWS